MIQFFFSFVLIFFFHSVSIAEENVYPKNSYVDSEVWDRLLPYFLPGDHPIKVELDIIFSGKKRVIRDKKKLKKAKFKIIRDGEYRHPYIVSHPRLEGYLLKVYTDRQEHRLADKRFFYRINGAKFSQECIDKHGYQAMFKVPKKWIYPIPCEPSPPNKKKYIRKDFLLVVEDMDIFDKEENNELWKSSLITPELLEATYTILSEVGLSDSIFAFNIPFSMDGKIAILDTEYYHRWPIKFFRLGRYLSPEMKEFWKLLVINHALELEEALGE